MKSLRLNIAWISFFGLANVTGVASFARADSSAAIDPSSITCSKGSDDQGGSSLVLKDGTSIGGSYDFDNKAQCQNSLDHMKDGLVCVPGPTDRAWGVFDVKLNRFAERFYRPTLQSCFLAESSSEVAASRNAQIPTGAVENCDDKDAVRLDSVGGSMEHVSVRYQGDEGICYAETAAEATDAWRFTHGDTQYHFVTSSVIAALQTDVASNDWELSDGGDSADAIKAISEHGACNQSATIEGQDSEKLDDLIAILQNLVNARRGRSSLAADDLAPLKDFFAQNASYVNQGYLPDSASAVQTVETTNPHQLLSAILDYPCKGSNLIQVKMPALVQPFEVTAKDPLAIANYLSSKLETPQSLPVTIAVCGNTIDSTNSNYRQIFTAGGNSDCDDQLHAMLLIGKRKNPTSGRCEFLFRNSWGEDCAQAGADFTCENGSIWMDADVATRAMEEIQEFGNGVTQPAPVIHRRPIPRRPYTPERRRTGPTTRRSPQ